MDENEFGQYVILDCETTGFYREDKIIQLAMIKYQPNVNKEIYNEYFNPLGRRSDPRAFENHRIPDKSLEGRESLNEANAERILEFLEGSRYVVGHNIIKFDWRMLVNSFENFDEDLKKRLEAYKSCLVDTCKLARKAFPEYPSYKLEDLKNSLDLQPAPVTLEENLGANGMHNAVIDCAVTKELLHRCVSRIQDRDTLSVAEILA